ncbi:MAG: DUF349 domain-containing protein [Bacteroidales bacterium]|jgi:hypothetical protein|nr:DUF349 domain-containing protein [Bacteroidales bacterium]
MDDLTKPQPEEVGNTDVEMNNIEDESTKEAVKTTDVEKITEDEIQEETDTTQFIKNYARMTEEELLAEMKQLYEASNFEQLKAKASLIRNAFNNLIEHKNRISLDKFIAEGGNAIDFKAAENKIETDFHNLYQSYKDKRQKYLEEQEKIKQTNLVKKQAVLDELRTLLDADGSLKEIYDQFNLIQDKWKEIGQVPRSEVNALWENYHFLIEKFYDKVKLNRELRDMDMKKNLDAKIGLCEKAEALLLDSSVNDSFHTLQDIQQQWREIGPVPSDKNDEIWERFRLASEKINERRQEYYQQKFAEMELNLKAKTELCDKIDEILGKEISLVKDWLSTTTEVDELKNLWRSIGGIPKKHNEVLWTRFKTATDTFYARKKEAFDKMKAEQIQNYNEKVEICLKAEAIAIRSDWKKATAELLELQQKWKTIGYISKERSEKLWQRFRKACDEFFAKKAASYEQNRASEEENINKKRGIIDEVKAFEFGAEQSTNLDAIKEFQRRWSEIGYTSPKIREELYAEFRAAIDAHFDKLKTTIRDSELSKFKDKFVSNLNSHSGNVKRDLKNQISTLQKELNLWENNIGFLSKSKSTDVLRAEYEKKLEKTRQQIALLEAKIKMIDKEAAKKKEEVQTNAASSEQTPQAEEEAKE